MEVVTIFIPYFLELMRVYEYNPFVLFGILNFVVFFLINFFQENINIDHENSNNVKQNGK